MIVSGSSITADMRITSDPTVGWIAGENIWSVPFGWHQAGTTGDADPYKSFAAETTQIFTIDPTGTTSVRKLGNEASREISGHVFLNGERVWQEQ